MALNFSKVVLETRRQRNNAFNILSEMVFMQILYPAYVSVKCEGSIRTFYWSQILKKYWACLNSLGIQSRMCSTKMRNKTKTE